MKKSLPIIAGLSMLALGVPSVSFAQAGAASGPFADVPADHWAYQSVDTLQKAGIVIGYPDGTYGGKRAMTRYEFAVAIARLMPLINNQPKDVATKDDLAALRADLEKKLQANSDAIDALRKLVDEFQPELQKLGQDVAAVKDRLDSLEARVAVIEEELKRVKFTGALNLIARAENITKGTAWVDKNGDAISTGTKHLLAKSDVYQDFVLGVRGKVSDKATVNVKMDFGNFLSALGNAAANANGNPLLGDSAGNSGTAVGSLNAGNQQQTLWEANVTTPVDLGPLGGAELVAGRFGQQWTKYTLQQIDADVYTNLYQTDSGNVIIDGAKFDLNVGPAKVNAFVGKTSAIPYAQLYAGNQGGSTQALPAGFILQNHATTINQGAGIRATFGNPENGVLGLSLAQYGLGSNAITDPDSIASKKYGVLSVYGIDFNGAFPIVKTTGLTLDASLTESALATKSANFNDTSNGWRNAAVDTQVGYTFGALSLKGGYQYVGPNFTAPGYWGKVGSWTNPTNVEGGVASAKYVFNPKLTLNADYQGYKAAYGSAHTGAVINSPLHKDDKVTRYQLGLAYGLTSDYNVDLGYEQVTYDLKGGAGITAGKPYQQFINIGLGHTFSQNASFKLLYQIGRYRDKSTGFNGVNGDADGNVAVGQFSLKF